MNDPCQVPLTFYAGETFIPPAITWLDQNSVPVNLVGYSASLTFRQTITTNDPPFLLATTGNGMIALGGALGTIQVNVSATVTATFAVPFCGVWDLFVYSSTGVATRLVGGNVNIREAVTRP